MIAWLYENYPGQHPEEVIVAMTQREMDNLRNFMRMTALAQKGSERPAYQDEQHAPEAPAPHILTPNDHQTAQASRWFL